MDKLALAGTLVGEVHSPGVFGGVPEAHPARGLCELRGGPSMAPSCAGGPGDYDSLGFVLIGLEFGMEMLKITRIITII